MPRVTADGVPFPDAGPRVFTVNLPNVGKRLGGLPEEVSAGRVFTLSADNVQVHTWEQHATEKHIDLRDYQYVAGPTAANEATFFNLTNGRVTKLLLIYSDLRPDQAKGLLSGFRAIDGASPFQAYNGMAIVTSSGAKSGPTLSFDSGSAIITAKLLGYHLWSEIVPRTPRRGAPPDQGGNVVIRSAGAADNRGVVVAGPSGPVATPTPETTSKSYYAAIEVGFATAKDGYIASHKLTPQFAAAIRAGMPMVGMTLDDIGATLATNPNGKLDAAGNGTLTFTPPAPARPWTAKFIGGIASEVQ
jgi:hypothetical protein